MALTIIDRGKTFSFRDAGDGAFLILIASPAGHRTARCDFTLPIPHTGKIYHLSKQGV